MQPCSSVNRSRKFAQQSNGGVPAETGSSKRQKTADGAPAALRRPLQDLQSNSRPHNQATAQQQHRAQVRAQQLQQESQAWAQRAAASEEVQGSLENAAPPARPSRQGQSKNSFA
jgi:hypothetical protein